MNRSFSVFFVSSVVTITAFIVWNSLLLALLSGATVMTVSIIMLSLAIYAQKVRYDARSLAKEASIEIG